MAKQRRQGVERLSRKLRKEEVQWVLDQLEETFPDAKPELVANNPFEMLVATILSAQCTDVRVNKVTKELYKSYQTPEDFVHLGVEGLEPLIRSCGFYKNKAKNIVATAKILVEDYHSKVPESIEELKKLPGVGQKTANVVASTCFGVDAIAVDTHVFRTSNRLGLAKAKTVEETEVQLQKAIPKNRWSKSHHLLIFLGRRICSSRNPKCAICPLKEVCQYDKKTRS